MDAMEREELQAERRSLLNCTKLPVWIIEYVWAHKMMDLQEGWFEVILRCCKVVALQQQRNLIDCFCLLHCLFGTRRFKQAANNDKSLKSDSGVCSLSLKFECI